MERLSPCAPTPAPVLQSPGAATTEAPVPWGPRGTTEEATSVRSPCLQVGKSAHSNKDPPQPKKKKNFFQKLK